MDFGKAFGYVFEDPKWLGKVLLGGVITLIPLLGQFIVGGYSLKVAHNVARGSATPLPDWGEFGDALVRGLKGWVINLVYSLPAALLYGIAAAITGVGAAITSDSEGRGGTGGLVGLCLFPLVFVLFLICALASLNALARFVATDDWTEAFKFNEVINSLRSSISPAIMLLLLAIVAGLVASLGIIACGVGLLFTWFYAQLVVGHGLGQTVTRLFPERFPQGMAGYAPPPSYGPPPTIQ